MQRSSLLFAVSAVAVASTACQRKPTTTEVSDLIPAFAGVVTVPEAPPTPRPNAAPMQTPVQRGAFLVRIGGCTDCHTPMKFDPELGMPVPDMSRYLSGHPQGAPRPNGEPKGHDQAVIGPTFTSFRLPFGTVFTANLTPDRETGLGNWTEDMFVRAMRTGRHMGGAGRPIVPPMPWINLNAQSDDDLEAIFAYLQSVPAIKNEVPQPEVPGPVLDGLAASYDKVLARMRSNEFANR